MYCRLLVGYGYYRDNIVYRDNLKNTMKTYRDIAFSIIAQPYILVIKKISLSKFLLVKRFRFPLVTSPPEEKFL